MKLALAFVLLLAGCAQLTQGPGPVDAIVGETIAAVRAPAAEQQAVLARAEQAAAGGAPADRLRLAMLLASLPAPLRNDARAADLLQPLADAGSPGVGRFAALASAQLTERLRLARDAAAAARERERTDKERDKREEAMRQQLEALRTVERGILEREDKLRRRKDGK